MYHLICCFVFSNQLKLDHITAIFPTSLEGSIKQALFSESLSGAVFLLLKKNIGENVWKNTNILNITKVICKK